MVTKDFTFLRTLGQGSQARVDLYVKRYVNAESYEEVRNCDGSKGLAEERSLLRDKEGKLSSNTVEGQ